MEKITQDFDSNLAEILLKNNLSLSGFFSDIFGFLYRRCPADVYGSQQINGMHLIGQSFSKWQLKYLQDIKNAQSQIVEINVPLIAAEVELTSQIEDVVNSNEQNIVDLESAHNVRSEKKMLSQDEFDATNGAKYERFVWTQTIEDVEVRVPVPSVVLKGKQVRVTLTLSTLEVSVQEKSDWCILLSGEFPHTIKCQESIWSLSGGHHVLINLEKGEHRWWDRLIKSHDPIDMKHINAERDFSTLPQDEQQKIEELMWNRQQQAMGRPTSDVLKMESVLRQAWNTEGSPFQNQPFDPSVINFMPGGSFGQSHK